MAEARGNRTHRRRFRLPTGFEVRGGHQRPIRFRAIYANENKRLRATARNRFSRHASFVTALSRLFSAAHTGSISIAFRLCSGVRCAYRFIILKSE